MSKEKSAEKRLKCLEEAFLNGIAKSNGLSLSIETLLDAFLVLFDECNSAGLRREKNVSGFVESSKSFIMHGFQTFTLTLVLNFSHASISQCYNCLFHYALYHFCKHENGAFSIYLMKVYLLHEGE